MERYLCPLKDLQKLEGKHALCVRLDDGLEIGVLEFKGQLHAYENRCPHMGGPICLGEIIGKTEVELGEHKKSLREYVSADDVRLICPWHGLEYHVQTGACATDDRYKLRQYEVTVRGEDIYVKTKQ